MSIITEPVVMAAIGGGAYQILPVLENLKSKSKTKVPQLNFRFFVLIIGYAAIGGVVGYAYVEEGTKINKIMALHIGISAPLVLRALGSIVPKLPVKPAGK